MRTNRCQAWKLGILMIMLTCGVQGSVVDYTGTFTGTLAPGSTPAALETFLNLGAGSLVSAALQTDNLIVEDGAAVNQTVTVQAGQTLSWYLNFISGDYFPYDDFAFFSFALTTPPTPAEVVIPSFTDPFWGFTATRVDYDKGGLGGPGVSTGSFRFSNTFTSAGTYLIGFGVVNAYDMNEGLPSAGEIYDSTLAVFTPEPGSSFLVGAALLGLAAAVKRFRK